MCIQGHATDGCAHACEGGVPFATDYGRASMTVRVHGPPTERLSPTRRIICTREQASRYYDRCQVFTVLRTFDPVAMHHSCSRRIGCQAKQLRSWETRRSFVALSPGGECVSTLRLHGDLIARASLTKCSPPPCHVVASRRTSKNMLVCSVRRSSSNEASRGGRGVALCLQGAYVQSWSFVGQNARAN